jgi:hypothetical protein
MTTNLDRYRADLSRLIDEGGQLQNAMTYDLWPDEFKKVAIQQAGKEASEKLIEGLPSFKNTYQTWYSEALALIRQVLPDRVEDFVSYYEPVKNRKGDLHHGNYTIRDYLDGLHSGTGKTTPKAGFPKFEQQLRIVTACKARFDSSLFEIRQLVQADLFDSEIDAARALLKHGFGRAAGAIAGVVLERHLKQVCMDHRITITKKNPTINDLNQALKDNSVTDIPQWRHISLLADIRNLCDHNKSVDPSDGQITDLLDGTTKVLKTIL